MNNPFKKQTLAPYIAAIAIATIAVGALAYLYLTKKGKGTGKGLKKKLKSIAKDAAVKAVGKKTGIKKETVKAAADHLSKTD